MSHVDQHLLERLYKFIGRYFQCLDIIIAKANDNQIGPCRGIRGGISLHSLQNVLVVGCKAASNIVVKELGVNTPRIV